MAKISHWRIYCDTDSVWRDWYLPATQAAPTACTDDTGHAVDAAKTRKVTEDVTDSGRLSSDGTLAVKIDPGTAETDPKFESHRVSAVPSTAGSHDFVATRLQPGHRIQGVIYQLEEPVFGDEIDVLFQSDGTLDLGGGPIPQGTDLRGFGPCNVPMSVGTAVDGSKWAVDRVMFDVSKEIPAGVQVVFRYVRAVARTGDTRMTFDFLTHQE